jgi:hypothetical protein
MKCHSRNNICEKEVYGSYLVVVVDDIAAKNFFKDYYIRIKNEIGIEKYKIYSVIMEKKVADKLGELSWCLEIN